MPSRVTFVRIGLRTMYYVNRRLKRPKSVFALSAGVRFVLERVHPSGAAVVTSLITSVEVVSSILVKFKNFILSSVAESVRT